MLGVKGAIKYEQDELAACKSLVDQCLSDDPDTIISYASISFKEQGLIIVRVFSFNFIRVWMVSKRALASGSLLVKINFCDSCWFCGWRSFQQGRRNTLTGSLWQSDNTQTYQDDNNIVTEHRSIAVVIATVRYARSPDPAASLYNCLSGCSTGYSL